MIFFRINTINKKIFKNYKYDDNCKDQNANKKMKLQI